MSLSKLNACNAAEGGTVMTGLFIMSTIENEATARYESLIDVYRLVSVLMALRSVSVSTSSITGPNGDELFPPVKSYSTLGCLAAF